MTIELGLRFFGVNSNKAVGTRRVELHQEEVDKIKAIVLEEAKELGVAPTEIEVSLCPFDLFPFVNPGFKETVLADAIRSLRDQIQTRKGA